MQNKHIIGLLNEAIYHSVKFQVDIRKRLKMAFEQKFCSNAIFKSALYLNRKFNSIVAPHSKIIKKNLTDTSAALRNLV